MHRRLYLASLVLLQIALIAWVARPLAQALNFETAPGLAAGGWPAVLQLVATAITVVASSVVLGFPVVAFARHRRSRALRFAGLPKWATVIAACGAAALCVGFLAHSLVPALPADARFTAVLVARSVAAAGLALATAGVLCSELLRRSVAITREAVDHQRARSARIEVTHPPELRTRVA
jgi:hypothetical protein